MKYFRVRLIFVEPEACVSGYVRARGLEIAYGYRRYLRGRALWRQT